MQAGNVALQVFSMPTKTPRHMNSSTTPTRPTTSSRSPWRSAGRRATWRSLTARALALRGGRPSGSRRAPTAPSASSAPEATCAPTSRTAPSDPSLTAGLLSIEGAHALDDDPANVDVVFDAGVRMISPSHFFDTAFGGSAHGMEQGGLTAKGREMVARMEAQGHDPRPRPRVGRDDRRRAGYGDAARRRLAHGRQGRLRQQPQPARRAPAPGSPRPAAWWGSGSGTWRRAARSPSGSPGRIAYAVERIGAEHVGLGLGLGRRRRGAVRRREPRGAHRAAPAGRPRRGRRSAWSWARTCCGCWARCCQRR